MAAEVAEPRASRERRARRRPDQIPRDPATGWVAGPASLPRAEHRFSAVRIGVASLFPVWMDAGVIVLGLSLLASAGIMGMAGLRDWRLWTVMRQVAPTTPDQLAESARTGRLRRELVAVAGVARANRAGPLTSTVNAQPCVWHRHIVHRRRVRRSADGRTRPSLMRRRVADVSSREPLILAGTAATIGLLPEGIHVDRPARAATRILPGLVSQPFPDAEGLMGSDLYVHREWIIPSGAPLYVLGEATTTATGLIVRRPAKGPHLISTRSAGGLRRHALATAITGFGLSATAAAGGVAVLILL